MTDITMCTNALCPNAEHCYRVQAPPSEHWQSMFCWDYNVDKNGVICDGYIPMQNKGEEQMKINKN